MALSVKHGKLNIAGIGEEELVFGLHAQDKLGCSAIETYQILTSSYNCQPRTVKSWSSKVLVRACVDSESPILLETWLLPIISNHYCSS